MYVWLLFLFWIWLFYLPRSVHIIIIVVVYIIPNGLSTAKLDWEWEGRWMWSYCAGAFIIFVLFWYIREAVWLCVCLFSSLFCVCWSLLSFGISTPRHVVLNNLLKMCVLLSIYFSFATTHTMSGIKNWWKLVQYLQHLIMLVV